MHTKNVLFADLGKWNFEKCNYNFATRSTRVKTTVEPINRDKQWGCY